MKTISSPNKYSGRNNAIRVVVLHTMEAPEKVETAENIASYFSKSSTRASAHICVDSNSEVRCVADRDTAWAAPGANSDGLQLEMAGYAGQTAKQWADAYSTALLKRAARIVATWCTDHGIPIKHLTVAELRAGKKGIVDHDDVSKAYGRSSHWDVGPNFPWTKFMELVRDYATGRSEAASRDDDRTPVKPSTTTRKPHRIATIRKGDRTWRTGLLQDALIERGHKITSDNVFGDNTEKALRAFQKDAGLPVTGVCDRKTWFRLTWGVRPGSRGAREKVHQRVCGFTGSAVDGVNGKNTDARTREVQRWLGVDDDGIVKSKTTNALIKKG